MTATKKYTRKRQVTLPLLKILPEETYIVETLGELVERTAPDSESDTMQVVRCRIIEGNPDFEGLEVDLICNTTVCSAFAAYKGKMEGKLFEITNKGKAQGKRYYLFEIFELEAGDDEV